MADRARPPRPSFDDALAIVRAHAPSPGQEQVALLEALHRVTAANVYAASDYPRFDAAAMDGYGVAAADSRSASPERPILLRVVGASRAGELASQLAPFTACRISTGAPIPARCDCVLPTEEAQIDQGHIMLDSPARAGRNVRRRGEDARAGALVLVPGTEVTPAIIGALACYGVESLSVTRRPAVTIVPTGDELLAQPEAGRPAAIHDANTVMISALLRTWGLDPARAAPVGDDRSALARAISAAAVNAQIVVTTGGAAGGDHDHLADALAQLGAIVHFHGVRMRPGKPMLFATLPNGALFFGLPGNPVAALLGARFFLGAAVRGMTGLPPEHGEHVAVACDGKPGVTLLLKAVRTPSGAKGDAVAILEDQRSHTLRPLIAANCWVVADQTESGDRRRVYPLT